MQYGSSLLGGWAVIIAWLSMRMRKYSANRRFYLSSSFSSIDSLFLVTLSLQERSQPSAIPISSQCALFRTRFLTSSNFGNSPTKSNYSIIMDQSQPFHKPPLPNPQRTRDGNGCLLPKVFIAYPHNPSPYTQLDPDYIRQFYPNQPDHIVEQCVARDMQHHTLQQEEVIRQHMSKVHSLGQFLQQTGIAVSHDQLLLDCGSDNIMRWCQEQIEDSDFVILIITNSFKDFLDGEPPPEKEHLFVGNYLSNFINNPRGKQLLPVFLDLPVNSQLIPKCLEMCRLYSVYTPPSLVIGRGDDLQLLYALLTKQDRYAPPAPSGVIKLNSRRRRSKMKASLWAMFSFCVALLF